MLVVLDCIKENKMATYSEAVKHVLSGGKAWEMSTWDTNSLLYSVGGELLLHCGASNIEIGYDPDFDELKSDEWELINIKE